MVEIFRAIFFLPYRYIQPNNPQTFGNNFDQIEVMNVHIKHDMTFPAYQLGKCCIRKISEFD